ncbi:hypothetical protein PHLGIDRAFT_406788 [Phlebiopsis gigantea 11061_1 CR5-6]|uniref:Uncharacterized protein n=1 Tax=Phlebiopsis gigantea (strain 11061_1 CR5-6) TaxID=745531 RepID=A0A0C3RZJ9_PHLG1|nr:hypothetical protein PHLGIDRAFT_406788 [Phlebiopsis gigantea 11061_1 CR5-6]
MKVPRIPGGEKLRPPPWRRRRIGSGPITHGPHGRGTRRAVRSETDSPGGHGPAADLPRREVRDAAGRHIPRAVTGSLAPRHSSEVCVPPCTRHQVDVTLL